MHARYRGEMRWIDVEAFPGEEPEHRSSDFSAPRARAALRAFHDRYVALLAAGGRAARVEGGVESAVAPDLGGHPKAASCGHLKSGQ